MYKNILSCSLAELLLPYTAQAVNCQLKQHLLFCVLDWKVSWSPASQPGQVLDFTHCRSSREVSKLFWQVGVFQTDVTKFSLWRESNMLSVKLIKVETFSPASPSTHLSPRHHHNVETAPLSLLPPPSHSVLRDTLSLSLSLPLSPHSPERGSVRQM